MATYEIRNPLIMDVAVGKYDNQKAYSGYIQWDDLKCSENDKKMIQQLWQTYEYEIEFTNTKEEFTKEEMIIDLQKMANKAVNDNHDSIVITYSGHGLHQRLLFSDAKVSEFEWINNNNNNMGQMKVHEIMDYFSESEELDKIIKILILDKCEGDKVNQQTGKGRPVPHQHDKNKANRNYRNWFIITSNSIGHRSFYDHTSNTSYFTSSFVKIMRKNINENNNLEQLHKEINQDLETETKPNKAPTKQTSDIAVCGVNTYGMSQIHFCINGNKNTSNTNNNNNSSTHQNQSNQQVINALKRKTKDYDSLAKVYHALVEASFVTMPADFDRLKVNSNDETLELEEKIKQLEQELRDANEKEDEHTKKVKELKNEYKKQFEKLEREYEKKLNKFICNQAIENASVDNNDQNNTRINRENVDDIIINDINNEQTNNNEIHIINHNKTKNKTTVQQNKIERLNELDENDQQMIIDSDINNNNNSKNQQTDTIMVESEENNQQMSLTNNNCQQNNSNNPINNTVDEENDANETIPDNKRENNIGNILYPVTHKQMSSHSNTQTVEILKERERTILWPHEGLIENRNRRKKNKQYKHMKGKTDNNENRNDKRFTSKQQQNTNNTNNNKTKTRRGRLNNNKNNKFKHKCEECGRLWPGLTNLKLHMRTHTGEKPYECPLCNKRFGRKFSVKMHMTVHNNCKPFRCGKCSFKTKWRLSLTGHMRNRH